MSCIKLPNPDAAGLRQKTKGAQRVSEQQLGYFTATLHAPHLARVFGPFVHSADGSLPTNHRLLLANREVPRMDSCARGILYHSSGAGFGMALREALTRDGHIQRIHERRLLLHNLRVLWPYGRDAGAILGAFLALRPPSRVPSS